MREVTNAPRDALEACLDIMNFGQSWSDWRASLEETVNAAREIDPSDQHVLPVVEDMIDFLASRVCTGSPEERFVIDLWDHADPGQREVLARIFLKMLDTGAPTAAP